MKAEQERLQEAREKGIPWKKWGPYLSERQWGTVREDYSEGGGAWDYFTHDQARSRAYHWGEDGLAGISDDKQILCFALALWNGVDPIIKERLFGLSNSEANHGEDVKEYYYYLDSTPTHSYMKYLYKYPQAPFPYEDLVKTNRGRSREEMEYELMDTGVFNENRYFDVFVEYAKGGPEDLLIQITLANRGPQAAELHVLPTAWFRNTWSWNVDSPRPVLHKDKDLKGSSVVVAEHADLGTRYLYCQGTNQKGVPLLFTENETNTERIFGTPNASPYVKDGINQIVVHGETGAVNPAHTGSKIAAHYTLAIPAGESQTIWLRLTDHSPKDLKTTGAFTDFQQVFVERLKEADQFYDSITPDNLNEDSHQVLRQALSGMLWTKQFYFYDIDRWLEERGAGPLAPASQRKHASRNEQWYHMYNADIISMPDKWEYPWYAAWDLAFHTIALSMVDPDFAKDQLELMLREQYLHPNGQIPAYEWNFSDVNPPVHAWATLFNYRFELLANGEGDVDFLKHAFQKLLLNFTWWVNRKDPTGKNVFDGGFLGLDNIGVFDRSAVLPSGGHLEQADGTAWMALYSQNMLEIALNLAMHDPVYEDMANKFLEHFLWIAAAMDRIGENEDEMWDEEDGFFYDLLRLPDGSAQRLKVRSMVGLLPLCASAVIPTGSFSKLTRFQARAAWFMKNRPELVANLHTPMHVGHSDRRLLALLDETKLRRVLKRMLDEEEFLSPYGIRALSRSHLEHPYVFKLGGEDYTVSYLPAESNTGMFGGNSNWRGPIWMPVNILIIRSLLNYYAFFGNDFQIEYPTDSGNMMTLYQVAEDIGHRLASIFLQDASGRRPVFGGSEKFQSDPHWRDYILFYEYFHGDNGAGLGASHQTGWTGLVAKLLQMFNAMNAQQFLEDGRRAAMVYKE